jgi:CDP-alcohol phosphatidyltransferase
VTTTPPITSVQSIWTKVAVDPTTIPIARRLSNASAITPNKVTALAGLFAVGPSVAFLLGELRIGGVLFVLRYAFDELDGQLARSQSRSSTVGAALDVIVDIVGIFVVLASLTSYLVSVTTDVPILRRWTLFCARPGMSPLPWAIEAEVLALGLGPLLLPHRFLPCTLIFVLAAYVASIVNIRRIWLGAGAMDSVTAHVS